MMMMTKREQQRRGVRPYNRSDAPRMRWTEELHARFVDAVQRLGGHRKATPKRILLLMREREVSLSHVKSHLQMYRNVGDSEISTAACTRRAVDPRKMLDPDDPVASGHVQSSARSPGHASSNPCCRESLEEHSSMESESNNADMKFEAQSFQNRIRFNQSPARSELNLLDGGRIGCGDSSCELTLSTFDHHHSQKATLKEEPMWLFPVDHADSINWNANRSRTDERQQVHSHRFDEACINLELRI